MTGAPATATPGTVNIGGHRVSMKILGGLVMGVIGLLVLRSRQRARAAAVAVPTTGQGDGVVVPGYDSNQSAIAGISESLNQLQATVQQNMAAGASPTIAAAPAPSAPVDPASDSWHFMAQQFLGRTRAQDDAEFARLGYNPTSEAAFINNAFSILGEDKVRANFQNVPEAHQYQWHQDAQDLLGRTPAQDDAAFRALGYDAAGEARFIDNAFGTYSPAQIRSMIGATPDAARYRATLAPATAPITATANPIKGA